MLRRFCCVCKLTHAESLLKTALCAIFLHIYQLNMYKKLNFLTFYLLMACVYFGTSSKFNDKVVLSPLQLVDNSYFNISCEINNYMFL